MYLTESFKLPVSFGKITLYPYRQEKTEYSQEEVKAKAWQELQNYEEKLMEKGVQISANNVKIEKVDLETCISERQYFLEIVQKTGTGCAVRQGLRMIPAERDSAEDELNGMIELTHCRFRRIMEGNVFPGSSMSSS